MLPALDWLRGYRREWLGPDLLAGTTTGAVVIPQAMAYATVATLPVEIGLYTCIFPMIVDALLGGARRMSVSTTSTIVALTGGALLSAGVADDAEEVVSALLATLTLLVGAVLLVARLLRIGFLVESVSENVFAETEQQLDRAGVQVWVAAIPTRALVKARRTAAWDGLAECGRLHPTVGMALEAFRRPPPTRSGTRTG